MPMHDVSFSSTTLEGLCQAHGHADLLAQAISQIDLFLNHHRRLPLFRESVAVPPELLASWSRLTGRPIPGHLYQLLAYRRGLCLNQVAPTPRRVALADRPDDANEFSNDLFDFSGDIYLNQVDHQAAFMATQFLAFEKFVRTEPLLATHGDHITSILHEQRLPLDNRGLELIRHGVARYWMQMLAVIAAPPADLGREQLQPIIDHLGTHQLLADHGAVWFFLSQ